MRRLVLGIAALAAVSWTGAAGAQDSPTIARMVVDDRITAAPVISSPITSGAAVLAGPGSPSATWSAILTDPPLPGLLAVESIGAAASR